MPQQLLPAIIISIILAYFAALIVVSYFTGRKGDNAGFFLAGRQSNWILVAVGMVGASLSGVTFISIPGVVGNDGLNMAFSYMQVVFGYLIGYLIIATVLLPLYYRLQLTSIYEYLQERLGFFSYKTGAAYFLISRTLGASLRLFLVAIVLDRFVLGPLGVPFWLTVAGTIILIWVYTFRGGIRTIVITDTLQTICMLLALVLTIFGIGQALEMDLGDLVGMVQKSEYSKMFFFEGGWSDPNNFFKQVLSGMLITIVMTGLDQDMMQKNLSCPNLRDAQKNMFTFSIILVFANLLFLFLGALLYLYAANVGLEIPESRDQLFPTIALQNLSPAVGMVFIVGLIAAAYSSADSALTSLTTSFCVDFLGFNRPDDERTEEDKLKIRYRVHIMFSVILLVVILLLRLLSNDSVINILFKAAGYTYGPLLGLFAFGMFTKLQLREVVDLNNYPWGEKIPARLRKVNLLIIVCIVAPILSFVIDTYSEEIFYGFQFGFLNIALNGLLTFVGLVGISYHDQTEDIESYEQPE